MKAHNVVKSILALFLAVASVTSCQDKLKTGFAKGEAVRFSAGTDAAGTKAAYSGQGTTTIERIDWQEGDLIRIYCGQVSEPSEKYADYRVTDDITSSGGNSTARIEGAGGVGLRWGEGNHTFYAAYPSPASSGITTGISAEKVSANLPASQVVVGGVTETSPGSGNYVAAPDLKNMLMTAKAGPYTESTGIPQSPNVFLSFTPLTTAIKFTIKNGTGAELALTDVQLISGNGKTSAEPVINGAFSVDLDQTGIASGTEVQPFRGNAFKITYSRDYPLCTNVVSTSTDMADRTLTINVGTDEDPLRLAVDKELTFTFFLNPCHHFKDLTFKLVKSGGSWMSTRLGYTDGDGVFFPRHKKSKVEGLLVPEGAQWRVSFEPDITPWDAEHGESEDIDFENPEIEFVPIVTPWDTVDGGDVEMHPGGVATGIGSYADGGTKSSVATSISGTSVNGNVTMNFDATSGTNELTITSGSPWKPQYKGEDGQWHDAVAGEQIDGWISFDNVEGTGGSTGETVSGSDYFKNEQEADRACGFTIRPMAE